MIFKSFLPRTICLLLVLQVPIWFLADVLAPFTSNFTYDSTFKKVAQDLAADNNRTSKRCADIAQHYNLAWVHLADKNKKVSVSTRPIGLPESAHDAESSRVLDLKGSRFVELSQSFGKEELLTVGFRCPNLMDTILAKQVFPGQLPTGTVLTAIVLNASAVLAAYLAFLGIPLFRLLRNLGSGQDLPEKFPVYVSSELGAISQGVKNRFINLKEEHEKSITAARSDLSGVFAKEVEDRFVNRLAKDIVMLQSSDEVCDLIIHRLADEFIGVIKAGFGVEFVGDGQFRLIDDWGFSEEQSKQLQGLAGSRFAVLVRKITGAGFLKPDEMADKRLEQMAFDLACDQCLIVPIQFNGLIRAHLLFFVLSKDPVVTQKLDRTVKKLSEQVAPLWHLISNFEEAYRLSRFDYLTGARNRLFLEDTLSSMAVQQTAEGEKVEKVFLIFEGDNFRVIRGSYGPRTIDKLIKELAEELLSAFDKSVRFKKASSRIKFADYFYRINGCRFMLILEDTNLKRAVEIAESVIQTIAERKDWAHGMPSWSVSCGIATLQTNPADCLEEAMITLDYIRSKKQIGVVVLSKDVPPEYMSRAQSMNNAGNMAVFDPVAILQTLAQSQKSGILTATSNGKVFWAYLDLGKPSKARLGKLCGDAAVVEFISDFTDGSYRLQDISTLDTQTSDDMKNLSGAYLITTPMPELITFSTDSKDSSALAKVHLKTPDMIVHPTVEKQQGQIEKVLYKVGKSVNKLYLEVANDLWEHCNGRFSFDEIVYKMQDEVPMALVWSAADFLLQNKLIKFSRLRVSTHTDTAMDQQPSARGNSAPAAAALTHRVCVACRRADPLSQKFCVHCGAEMVAVTANE